MIETQIQTIQTLGYSQPEAQFLRVFALHSGYFVRRQFLRSMGVERGKRAQDFINQLIGRGHGCRKVFREDRRLFRPQSKVLYEALGDEDNRRKLRTFMTKSGQVTRDFIFHRPDGSPWGDIAESMQRLFNDSNLNGAGTKAVPGSRSTRSAIRKLAHDCGNASATDTRAPAAQKHPND